MSRHHRRSESLLVLALACACSPSRPAATRPEKAKVAARVVDCAAGGDDTAAVQAAMAAGTCLPAGTFNVDAPALGANGRRRDSMLTGATLCGAGSALTELRFRGDAHALYWVGATLTARAAPRDITITSTCLVDTVEQSHLLHVGGASDGVVISDVVLVHPPRTDGSPAGDCVNVVGSATAPNHGMTISHVTFESCARGGVQVSRGLDGLVVSDSTFSSCGFDVGSEGSGSSAGGVITRTLTNVELSHNHFSSPVSRGYSLELEWVGGAHVHHNVGDARPVFVTGADGAAFDHNSFTNSVVGQPVLYAMTEAHQLSSTDDAWVQTATASVVLAAPHDKNFQADLVGLSVSGSVLQQQAASDFVTLVGVAGFRLDGATLAYGGPAGWSPTAVVAKTSGGVPPAVAVPTTDVVETGTVRVGW